MAKLREIYEEEEESRSEFTYSLNENRKRLELELMIEKGQLAGLTATEVSLGSQRTELLAELRDLNTYAIHFEDLQQQIAALENEFQAHTHNLELARIGSELLRQRITNVNIVQDATLPEDPAGLSRMALLALGVLAALIAATSLALFVEYFDERIQTPQEAEVITSLPVLISIPRSSRQRVQTR